MIVLDHLDGLESYVIHTFPQPIPVSGIHVHCDNESIVCTLRASVIGS